MKDLLKAFLFFCGIAGMVLVIFGGGAIGFAATGHLAGLVIGLVLGIVPGGMVGFVAAKYALDA